MGRHSGFIALHACLAARHADIVLLPEMQISSLDGTGRARLLSKDVKTVKALEAKT